METKFAPYAPPAAVLAVIRHFRKRDVPERISASNLLQIGVTDSLLPRTVAALKFLGLMRDDLTTTEQFAALRYANDEQYEEVLGRILDDAYKDVLNVVDLTTAGEREIDNAFIPFSPGGQRQRMITLFLALANEAGWSPQVQAKPSTTRLSARKPDKLATKLKPLKNPKPGDSKADVRETPSATQAEGVVAFGVTDADLAALPDDEFDDVWTALGKLARARAKAARGKANATEPEGNGSGD